MCTFTFTFTAILSDGLGTAEDRFIPRVVRSLLGTLFETFVL